MKIKPPKGTWDFIILAWSAYVVFAIVFEYFQGENDEISVCLRTGDTIACAFFFFDVMWRWAASENKLGFWKWGWIDLIASIPTIDWLRWGRLLRVFRIFRIVRGMRSIGRIANYFFQDRTKALMVTALTILFGSILISAIFILQFETPNGNIRTAYDALWWAITTVTTVGYGDKFPISDNGRAVGIALMFVGISLFSTTSALVASWLLRGVKKEKCDSEKIDDIEKALARIEKLLEKK